MGFVIIPHKKAQPAVNISLNIWMEGNKTAKANSSVKVKLDIVR